MTLPGSTTHAPLEVGGEGPERRRYIFQPAPDLTAYELYVALQWILGGLATHLTDEELATAPKEVRRHLEPSE